MSLSKSQKTVLCDLATKLRIHSVESTTEAKSGHPTSCSSMAEIMSVLFFHTMRYDVMEPKSPHNDRFILSKGHAAPILYAAWAEAGLFPTSELLKLRTFDSDLEGHPTPRLNFVDVATGSLGQGLGISAGMAYVGKHLDKASYRTYCLMGDAESYEGSVWEALNFAGYYKLDNLCAIIDVNRLGQSDPAPLQHDMEKYRVRLDSFGFHAIVVNGHDVEELVKAFDEAAATVGKPTCILAKTFKGHDFPGISNEMNWHGKPLGDKTEGVLSHLRSLLSADAIKPTIPKAIKDAPEVSIAGIELGGPVDYKLGDSVATRQAYGDAILKLAKGSDRVVALDADVKNSTFSQKVRNAFPVRHIECFICEQNMVGVAMGMTCRDRCVAFVSTFACFFTRAFDNLRMGVISQTNVNVVGSHCGVSIGEDGPSQMGLEDLAMFRTLPGCTVFYPTDAVATERAVELAANTKGICYIRVSRPATEIIYDNDAKFAVGKAKILKQADDDKVLVIAAGITMEHARKAAKILEDEGICIRLLAPFTIKPIDKEAVVTHARQCGGKIITVEDHYPEGGIGDAVLDVVSECKDIILRKMCVRQVPRSGPSLVLLEKFGIGTDCIVKTVKDFVKV